MFKKLDLKTQFNKLQIRINHKMNKESKHKIIKIQLQDTDFK